MSLQKINEQIAEIKICGKIPSHIEMHPEVLKEIVHKLTIYKKEVIEESDVTQFMSLPVKENEAFPKGYCRVVAESREDYLNRLYYGKV